MRTASDLDVAGKRVLVRSDLNVPLAEGPAGDMRTITDDGRIRASVPLLRDLLDRGLTVAIGADEHGVTPLAECSVVVAPVKGSGGETGTIGVLGPTRMNYPQALAAVAVVSQRLGRRMEEG